MSKSKGNVVYADDLADEFGVDAVRYYVLHEIPYANDGNLTKELLVERINSDLANTLGNLVNRTIAMANKYFEGNVCSSPKKEQIDEDLISKINTLDQRIEKRMDNLEIGVAIDEIFDLLRRSNKYIDETTPWVLAKEENNIERLRVVIYNLLEAIRVSAIYLKPFMPETSDKIFSQLNISNDKTCYTDENEYHTSSPEPLFKRIENKM